MALAIFLISWLLADKNNFGRVRSFTEDRLGCARVQIASAAGLHRLPQGAKRRMFGNVFGSAADFGSRHAHPTNRKQFYNRSSSA